MITTRLPATWQELQQQVAQVLEECGFKVEIEKTISTARGEVEVDVYAEETIKGRRYTILCECKHWRSRIPQNVIHGFRAVMGDVGANIGYIVSLNGFQSGSFSAAELTNIQLVTWEEFQAAFEASWLETYFSPQILEKLHPILTYTEPLLPAWFEKLSDQDQDAFIKLKERYDAFGWFLMTLTPYHRIVVLKRVPTLPITQDGEYEKFWNYLPKDVLEAAGYRELMDASTEYGGTAIREFHALCNRRKLTDGA